MRIILLASVKGIGKRHDIKEVPDGYARNFLLPKNLATLATPERIQGIEKEKAREEERKQKTMEQHRVALEKIAQETLVIAAKANECGHLYATLHVEDIQKAIEKKTGDTLPRESFIFTEPIKTTGEHDITVHIGGLAKKLRLLVEHTNA